MNGKKAKALRREQGGNNKPQFRIIITVMPNGQLGVQGFPTNRFLARNIMEGALNAVEDVFFRAAEDGNLDPKGNLQQSPIIQQDKRIVIAGRA